MQFVFSRSLPGAEAGNERSDCPAGHPDIAFPSRQKRDSVTPVSILFRAALFWDLSGRNCFTKVTRNA